MYAHSQHTVYIYIYIYICISSSSHAAFMDFHDSLSICPYHPSIRTCPLNCILCLCRAVAGKFLLVMACSISMISFQTDKWHLANYNYKNALINQHIFTSFVLEFYAFNLSWGKSHKKDCVFLTVPKVRVSPNLKIEKKICASSNLKIENDSCYQI